MSRVKPEPPEGRYYSPSQVKKHDRCGLEWYFDKVWFLRESKDSAAAARGRDLHGQFQTWGEEGQDPEDSRLRLLTDDPDIQELCAEAQHEVELRVNLAPWGIGSAEDPVWFWGFTDVVKFEPATIGDLKTTKSIARNGKRPPELVRDLQLMPYAFAAFHQDPPEAVRVAFLYVQTEGAMDIDLVEATVPWEHVEAEWKLFLDKVRNMEQTRALGHPRLVVLEHERGNGEPCKAFGGCQHKALCRSGEVETMTDPKTPEEGNTFDVLYIDCWPTKPEESPELFSDWVTTIEAEYREKFGKPWEVEPYNDGTGRMKLAMAKAVVASGGMFLSKRSPLYREARAALIPRARYVVEGK